MPLVDGFTAFDSFNLILKCSTYGCRVRVVGGQIAEGIVIGYYRRCPVVMDRAFGAKWLTVENGGVVVCGLVIVDCSGRFVVVVFVVSVEGVRSRGRLESISYSTTKNNARLTFYCMSMDYYCNIVLLSLRLI